MFARFMAPLLRVALPVKKDSMSKETVTFSALISISAPTTGNDIRKPFMERLPESISRQLSSAEEIFMRAPEDFPIPLNRRFARKSPDRPNLM
jgi:hypothetical protein